MFKTTIILIAMVMVPSFSFSGSDGSEIIEEGSREILNSDSNSNQYLMDITQTMNRVTDEVLKDLPIGLNINKVAAVLSVQIFIVIVVVQVVSDILKGVLVAV